MQVPITPEQYGRMINPPDPEKSIKCGEFVVKDSGKRQEFETGARRDTQEGKPRFDLIPPEMLDRLAAVFTAGCVKYGEHNWTKGIPLRRVYASAFRHLQAWVKGIEDEDHAFQAAWNMMVGAYLLARIREGELPAELDDRGDLK